ncbi:MAG: DUF4062 domain-containing protein [Hyphomicrobiaceae bacterium]|nr:DUF4062 domain-containing protein [Hyphomicrobiaceae bacterium]
MVNEVRQIRIMVSSTREDLIDYREAAAKIIEEIARNERNRFQILNTSMEDNTQLGVVESAIEASKRWVKEADWICVILGWNYGTVANSDASGVSITEWEYRHALELREEGANKSIFVFVARDLNSADPYREVDVGKRDLKDWLASPHAEQMKTFRTCACGNHATMFRNHADFCGQFEATLRDAVSRLVPNFPFKGGLAELLVRVKNDCRACVGAVQQLDVCKRIHDALHLFRLDVLRKLWEEDLPLWNKKPELTERELRMLATLGNSAGVLTNRLEEAAKGLDARHEDLRRIVSNVVEELERLWPRSELRSGNSTEITECVNSLASVVQEAFTDANRAMVEGKSALDANHAALVRHIGEHRQSHGLNEMENRLLDSELGQIDSNKQRLMEALASHDKWQRYHDRLEIIYTALGTPLFDRELGRFAKTKLPGLKTLVCDFRPNPSGEAHQSSSSTGQIAYELGQHANALECQPDEERFRAFHAPFDEMFFSVDRATLAEVGRAEERVKQFEIALEKVIQAGTS